MANPTPFNPALSAFDIGNAYALALACQAAYDVAPVGSLLGKPSWPTMNAGSFQSFDDGQPDNQGTAIRGYVFVTADAVILVFRGTANVPGWLTDFNVSQVNDPDTSKTPLTPSPMVHNGFESGLNSVWAQILKIVTAQMAGGGRALWLTGHSLGAALATLAANRLGANGIQVTGIYSFGSPRVGNLDFFRGYKPVYYRCVNNDDIVPHVPMPELVVPMPYTPPAGITSALNHLVNLFQHCEYTHVGSLKYFNRNQQLNEGTTDPDTKDDLMLDAMNLLGQPPQSAVTDHFIANYVAAIANNL